MQMLVAPAPPICSSLRTALEQTESEETFDDLRRGAMPFGCVTPPAHAAGLGQSPKGGKGRRATDPVAWFAFALYTETAGLRYGCMEGVTLPTARINGQESYEQQTRGR